MSHLYKTWQTLRGAIGVRCAAHGFSLCEEESHPESFGSRYAMFSRGQARMRLIWDGKEQWFLLECLRNYDGHGASEEWQELGCVHFPLTDMAIQETAVLAGILPAAEAFLMDFVEEPTFPLPDLEGFYRAVRCLAVQMRSEGHVEEADRLGVLMSCAWTTGSELMGELLVSLEGMNGDYSKQSRRLLSECLHFAKHHRQLLGLD